MGETYRRDKGDSFLFIVEVNKPYENKTLESTTVTLGKTCEVGAAGKQGHNIHFSTDHELEKIIKGLHPFFSGKSEVWAESNDELISTPDFNTPYDDNPHLKYEDLKPEVIKRLSQSNDVFFGLYQDDNPRKLHVFMYETTFAGLQGRNLFSFNLQYYREDIMEIAFGLTNYPVERNDVEWIKSIMRKVN